MKIITKNVFNNIGVINIIITVALYYLMAYK